MKNVCNDGLKSYVEQSQIDNLERFSDHLLNRHFSANTAKCYRVDLEQFFKFVNKPVCEITEEDVGKFVNDKLQAYANSSISRKISVLRSFFKWANKEKLANQFPFDCIKPPKIKRKEFSVLSNSEIIKLLEQIDETNALQIRDKCIFLLCLNYGLKPSDLLLLKVGDLNFEMKSLIINSSKRSQKKEFNLAPEILSLISKYLLLRQQESLISEGSFLFINKHQQPLSTRSVRRNLTAYANLAGLNGEINPMSLRHNYAMRSLYNGKGICDLQKELGHQNVATTMLYIKAIQKEQEKSNADQSDSVSQCSSAGPVVQTPQT